MVKNKKREIKTSFMFPMLHQNVVEAVSRTVDSVRFCGTNDNEEPNNEWSTNVMGKFRCKNSACSETGWGSKKVAILIRGYIENGYNAEVFNQRCKSCNKLGILTLNEKSYVERVAYWIQKWAGVHVEKPYSRSKKGPPHEERLCEGCKKGLCRRSDDR